ncbi:MAG: hypothetical protein ACI9MR_004095 [Myxococcota bacterium]|jgi:hypothetical protein
MIRPKTIKRAQQASLSEKSMAAVTELKARWDTIVGDAQKIKAASDLKYAAHLTPLNAAKARLNLRGETVSHAGKTGLSPSKLAAAIAEQTLKFETKIRAGAMSVKKVGTDLAIEEGYWAAGIEAAFFRDVLRLSPKTAKEIARPCRSGDDAHSQLAAVFEHQRKPHRQKWRDHLGLSKDDKDLFGTNATDGESPVHVSAYYAAIGHGVDVFDWTVKDVGADLFGAPTQMLRVHSTLEYYGKDDKRNPHVYYPSLFTVKRGFPGGDRASSEEACKEGLEWWLGLSGSRSATPSSAPATLRPM